MTNSNKKTTSHLASSSRRSFIQYGALLLSGVSSLLGGCVSLLKGDAERSEEALKCTPTHNDKFDYIVVGSGAGGGPLACNLALNGFRVLLLEAGGDDEPCEYQVPALHPYASENEAMRWDFFVRHYADDTQQKKDEKYVERHNGVLYPRSGTLGGCTAHNAMILVYPHNSDWDDIAELMGDSSWHSENMQRYFQRLERCEYADLSEAEESRHGFNGWLPTNTADIKLLLADKALIKLLKAALIESKRHIANSVKRFFLKLRVAGDPNDWRFISSEKSKGNREGLSVLPLTIQDGKRSGSREYIRRVQQLCPHNLEVRTHALVQRVLLDEQKKAYGVEYLSGHNLYRADPRHETANVPITETVIVNREVIISAGAFNTPQILKLSGIGPRQELEKFNIDVKIDLAGVGENLQDRYEVSVVTRLKDDISLVKDLEYRCPGPGEEPDQKLKEWMNDKTGPYATNGATVAFTKRSFPDQQEPDLFIFGMIGDFRGYYPAYSRDVLKNKNIFTWAILKGHTKNRGGNVLLRSSDPRDVPQINFHYFEEGEYERKREAEEDLQSVVAGVKTVRNIIKHCGDLVVEEIHPGHEVKKDEDIRQFVRNQAWGHHASCTCKMGPATDKMAVVDSRFRVYGTRNLRIVDASIFPRIPGLFIVSAVYMISEKASDVIIEDAKMGTA